MPWIGRLADAKSEADLLQVCREYVARLSASELAVLPKECRPSRIDRTDDVRTYALSLLRYPAHGDNARLILRMADFFSKAAEQLNRFESPSH